MDSDFWEKEKSVLDWNFEEPKVEWFQGGELNITENCLDRHLESREDQLAIVWEPNSPEEKAIKLTYISVLYFYYNVDNGIAYLLIVIKFEKTKSCLS